MRKTGEKEIVDGVEMEWIDLDDWSSLQDGERVRYWDSENKRAPGFGDDLRFYSRVWKGFVSKEGGFREKTSSKWDHRQVLRKVEPEALQEKPEADYAALRKTVEIVLRWLNRKPLDTDARNTAKYMLEAFSEGPAVPRFVDVNGRDIIGLLLTMPAVPLRLAKFTDGKYVCAVEELDFENGHIVYEGKDRAEGAEGGSDAGA